jgi:hypothetical protein
MEHMIVSPFAFVEKLDFISGVETLEQASRGRQLRKFRVMCRAILFHHDFDWP